MSEAGEALDKYIQNLKVCERNYETVLLFIQDMLLCNRVRLSEVPFVIRTSETTIYCLALRVSRDVSCERYVEDLNVMLADIGNAEPSVKSKILEVMASYVYMSPFVGEITFENFREVVKEKFTR